jgi:dihydroorotate dehydrogenase
MTPYHLIRPLLFRLDAEQAHHLTLNLLRWAGASALVRTCLRRAFCIDDPRLAVDAFGLHFINRVGLAAGYDKNGVAVTGLSCLGFGHIEVGTVTRLPQVGNPRPRVHRLPEHQAVINRMGFPNAGIHALRVKHDGVCIGINIGKGKDTPVEAAADDYCTLLQQVYTQADYVTVNISSPNTLNLRQLQARRELEQLLGAITTVRNQLPRRIPLLVKIAPDLSDGEIDDVLTTVIQTGMDGLIATNTTTSRAGVAERYQALAGGLSGAPLRARSTQVVRTIAERTSGKLPLIGVGGILNADDALEKLDAGAWLVQLYTGLVYNGPGLVRQILRRLGDARHR